MKSWCPLSVLMVLSCYGIGEPCRSSDQTGKIFKVVEQDVSSGVRGGPQPASPDESPAPKSKPLILRTAIFMFGNKRYSLPVPSDARDLNLSPGENVCLREEDGALHVVTDRGKVLPGVPRPFPLVPANKKPGVPTRPDQNK